MSEKTSHSKDALVRDLREELERAENDTESANARIAQLEEALEEARVSARRDPKFYLARVLESGALAILGRTDEARNALATARQLRGALTMDEVKLSHGAKVAKALAPLW